MSGRPLGSLAWPKSVTSCTGSAMVFGGHASAVGALPLEAEFTVAVISLVLDTAPSVAVRRKTYVPAAEKLAVVVREAGLPKLTVPGPLILLHETARVLPLDEAAVPESVIPEG